MLRKVRCFNGWVAPGNQLFEFAARSTTLPLDTLPRLRRKFRRCARGIAKGVHLTRGSAALAPHSVSFFPPFLAKTRKGAAVGIDRKVYFPADNVIAPRLLPGGNFCQILGVLAMLRAISSSVGI